MWNFETEKIWLNESLTSNKLNSKLGKIKFCKNFSYPTKKEIIQICLVINSTTNFTKSFDTCKQFLF